MFGISKFRYGIKIYLKIFCFSIWVIVVALEKIHRNI